MWSDRKSGSYEGLKMNLPSRRQQAKRGRLVRRSEREQYNEKLQKRAEDRARWEEDSQASFQPKGRVHDTFEEEFEQRYFSSQQLHPLIPPQQPP